MDWFTASVMSAVLGSFGVIIRKTVVKIKGLESFIGMVKFLAIGIFLGSIHYIRQESSIDIGQIPGYYWQLLLANAALEVLAFWCLLRATHYAEVTYIGPMLAGSTIMVMLAAIPILGEVPSWTAAMGVTVIIIGIMMINYNHGEQTETSANNKAGLPYLLTTVFCWALTPIVRKIALEQLHTLSSDGPLFLASTLSISMAIGFGLVMIIIGEAPLVKERLSLGDSGRFMALTVAGSLVYSLSLWLHYIALGLTHTGYAVAIKDTAPIFVFILGYTLLGERERAGWKFGATIITLVGSAMIAFE